MSATVIGLGEVQGVTGTEIYLDIKTEHDVTARVDGNRSIKVGDAVVLDVYERVLFRDVYALE